MTLKSYPALVLAALLVTPALAQQPRKAKKPATRPGYEVRGQLRGAPAGTRVYVVDQLAGRQVRLDSATVDANGQFTLRGLVPEPAVYYLGVDEKPELLALPLTAGAHLRVGGDAAQLAATGTTAGSPEADALTAFRLARQENTRRMQALMQRYDASRDADTRAALARQARELDAQLAAATRHLARRPSFLAPYAALTLIGQDAQAVFLDSVTAVYQRLEPVSRYTRALLAYRAQQRATAVGAVAPDLPLTGPDGRLVPLSSLRGQYVLLDFWATGGQLSPEAARLRSAYRAKGFEVYGVLPTATPNELTDKQASDLGGWQAVASRAFRVRAVPDTLLVDPQGRIVARNLRGAALETKLAALLK